MRFEINGPIKSGKSNMQVARNGRHYPLPAWGKWRDTVVLILQLQAKQQRTQLIEVPIRMIIAYRSPDKRRRDVTGIADAIFHCLEASKYGAGIIRDDSLIKDLHFTTVYSPDNPGAEIFLCDTKEEWYDLISLLSKQKENY